MGERDLQPVPFKSLPAPVLRLLPTLFTYVELTTPAEADVGPEVQGLHVAHLRTLQAMLTASTETAGLAAGSAEPLVQRCDDLTEVRGIELAEQLSELNRDMQAWYAGDRDRLRAAIEGDPDRYRDLYRTEVVPRRILAVYADETWVESESIGSKLADRCWYDHRCQRETDGVVSLEGIDVVLLAPGTRPIGANIESAVVNAEIPVVVLAGWHKPNGSQPMAEFRTAFWYQKSGYRVLHRPFPAVSLYQAIDGVYLHHLAWRHATSGVAATATH